MYLKSILYSDPDMTLQPRHADFYPARKPHIHERVARLGPTDINCHTIILFRCSHQLTRDGGSVRPDMVAAHYRRSHNLCQQCQQHTRAEVVTIPKPASHHRHKRPHPKHHEPAPTATAPNDHGPIVLMRRVFTHRMVRAGRAVEALQAQGYRVSVRLWEPVGMYAIEARGVRLGDWYRALNVSGILPRMPTLRGA